MKRPSASGLEGRDWSPVLAFAAGMAANVPALLPFLRDQVFALTLIAFFFGAIGVTLLPRHPAAFVAGWALVEAIAGGFGLGDPIALGAAYWLPVAAFIGGVLLASLSARRFQFGWRPIPDELRPSRRSGVAGRRRMPRGALLTSAVLLAVPPLLSQQIPDHPLLTQVPASSRTASLPGLPWLSTAGNRIVDSEGRAVLLRGFDESALIWDRTHPPTPLDEQDVVLMQQAGMSVVRLAVDWYHIEPTRGQINQAYLAKVQQTVDLFNRHGMYVVLDMHFLLNWSSRFGGAGAPDWAVIPNVPDIQIGPRSINADYSPAVLAAQAYFWLSPDWRRDFSLAWQALAQRFRNDSGVAGYDIYNEPHPLPLPPNLFERGWMWPLYQRSIDAIGAVDANHLFFAEGTLFLGWPVAIDQLHAPGLVYSPHFYDGSLIPPDYHGDSQRLVDGVNQNLGEAKTLGTPMWVGETGIDHRLPLATQWTDTLLNLYDQHGVGWGWWQWRQNDGWGIRSKDGDDLDLAFLRHLARPYLVAAPQGVTAGAGDGLAGRLLLDASASHGSGQVEIGWSSLTLGSPQVTGSCVTGSHWQARVGRLTMQLEPGQGCRISISASG